MTKLVIVGLGIGMVHFEQANALNLFDRIITVDPDPNKQATYTCVEQMLDQESGLEFDASIICTPNFTHPNLIKQLAPYSDLIMVEKPGLSSAQEWTGVLEENPDTRIVMTKNNIFRNSVAFWQEEYQKSSVVNFVWINKNRVPFPGGWFTNKNKAWGGVSYDLMPHLIHMAITAGSGRISEPSFSTRFQKWNLADVRDTEYGAVNNVDPVYDVDDHCRISFEFDDRKINCVAAWKSDQVQNNMVEVQFVQEDQTVVMDLGLCPNEAYGKQLYHFLNMNEDQYKIQNSLDKFVLSCIENIQDNGEDTFYDDLDLEEDETGEVANAI